LGCDFYLFVVVELLGLFFMGILRFRSCNFDRKFCVGCAGFLEKLGWNLDPESLFNRSFPKNLKFKMDLRLCFLGTLGPYQKI
jgi:hypothetical protein